MRPGSKEKSEGVSKRNNLFYPSLGVLLPHNPSHPHHTTTEADLASGGELCKCWGWDCSRRGCEPGEPCPVSLELIHTVGLNATYCPCPCAALSISTSCVLVQTPITLSAPSVQASHCQWESATLSCPDLTLTGRGFYEDLKRSSQL